MTLERASLADQQGRGPYTALTRVSNAKNPDLTSFSCVFCTVLHGYHSCITEQPGTFRGSRCVPLTKLLRVVRPMDISDMTDQKVG